METKVRKSCYENMSLFHMNGNDEPRVIGFNTNVKNIEDLFTSYFENGFENLKDILIDEIVMYIFKNEITSFENINISDLLDEALERVPIGNRTNKETFISENIENLKNIILILIESINHVIQKLKNIFNDLEIKPGILL